METGSINRRRTSSCGTPCPASSSAMPRSIRAMNTCVSIASSIIGPTGSCRSSSMMRSRVKSYRHDRILRVVAIIHRAPRRIAAWVVTNLVTRIFRPCKVFGNQRFSRSPGLALGAGGRWFEYGDSGAREWYRRYSTGAERRLAYDVLVAAPLASRCDDGVREGRL